jgi:chitinase
VAYNAGNTVSYNGLVWSAKWWIQNSAPSATNEAWNLVSSVELPWDTAAAYQGGAEVNHEGRRYTAAYWTKGEEPGVAVVWSDIGEASCD